MRQISTLLWLPLLGILLLGCQPAPERQQSALNQLKLGSGTGSELESEPGAGPGFSPVLRGRALSFPADHLAHENFRIEWWYLTANLTTDQGDPLGLQWTQFRLALAPADTPLPTPGAQPGQAASPQVASPQVASPQVASPQSVSQASAWQTRQLYTAHAALTGKHRHLAQEKWSRGHPALAGVSASPLTVSLDDWRWQSEGASLFPARLTVAADDFGYSLSLQSNAPLQLQGEQGYSLKRADAKLASYYYSQPFIEVEGWVELDGNRVGVRGQAWLDREWSSQLLTREQEGWDWFALRLEDGSALMLYRLRGEQDFYSARRMFKDGSGHAIAPGDIRLEARRWQQTPSGKYPVSWHLQIPSEALDLSITPLNPAAAMPLSLSYWEGPIAITGSHSGLGYLELTGYD
ncbi:lipocalin-like domain-containing protein [Shewanella salipaludis]|uniref:Carotenoid 1,2-hydratase n=1 Tax=Shewanella salipaludis TaxID=2723052 RepID=A0A972FTJ8_9GAMM|nr:lipocalin-like domain-containing protein [Shewanella salipaludis]NMH64999.1 carotenoid 1,2-hydratase [Shewanella salipaludis]